jgi:hypothetical protein
LDALAIRALLRNSKSLQLAGLAVAGAAPGDAGVVVVGGFFFGFRAGASTGHGFAGGGAAAAFFAAVNVCTVFRKSIVCCS